MLLTGSSGLIGSALSAALRKDGHTVTPLSRAARQARSPAGQEVEGSAAGTAVEGSAAAQPVEGEVLRGPTWDPEGGQLDPGELVGHDAVVHLAGEPLGARRWNAEARRRIWLSRTAGTRLLASRLSELPGPPAVLVSASAVGYYGDRGDEELTEESPPGEGFLAALCRDWEAATAPAAEAGIRVVRLRSGIVLSTSGGALRRQLVPFKLGLGGPLGSGRQHMSWVAISDAVRAVRRAIEDEAIIGPVNVTAPHPVTNAEYAAALGRALGRPARLRVPATALAVALGRQMASELLLASQRALPKRLEGAGFSFEHPEIQGALRAVISG